MSERLSETELCPPALLRGQEEAFARDIERLEARRDEFVEVTCPACGARDADARFAKHGFEYVTCSHCRTSYMNPRPSRELMDAYYSASENYRFWAERIFPASESSRRDKIHRPWLARIVAYCERYGVPRGTLVEVGPGFGTFASLAAQAFERVVAVEPTPELARACRERGIEVVELPIERVGDEIEALDVVVAFEVIEHLFEPRSFVEQCARLARPGALLVLSCPNGEGFDISLLGELSLAVDPEHVNFFNPDSLTKLVTACGFDVLEATTPGRLDTEFVHDAIVAGRFDISHDPFLQRVLVDEWERLGWPFQQFLAEHGLSSHMWLVARRR
jgi:2-polyprenyl-3-methyl-5-hydroxy-6-metoxy-1,4-benzoquinol methylase